MKTETTAGMNRTGMDMSPMDSKEVVVGARIMPPSSVGDDSAIANVVAHYARREERVGTMPPPGTLKGAVKSALQALKGEAPLVLLDKLGERLAFERAGSRLWKGVLAKFDALGSFEGGPTRAEIEQIYRDEAEHFLLVASVIRMLGADPTAETPLADILGVASCGLIKVVTDPRTNLADALEAMLIAELTDNDAWDVLIDMCQGLSDQEVLSRFQAARAAEARHLTMVRSWVKASVLARAQGDNALSGRTAS
ncbi:ferritin-like domain-containing protein [Sorangium sp. So ce834]|uniref:ferritin-like domain-containing protein n=1 Tax=Sorangium sp. So ce834 TaxID=3133321 RepID=UPI003F5EA563